MPVKKKTTRKAPVRRTTMAAPGPMAAKSTIVDYKKRKKQEVQTWYKECVGNRPIAGLFAMTFRKKSGVYGNPELLVAVYRLPKRATRGTTYPFLVGALKYGYGNGLNDIEQYLSPAQFAKFWYTDSTRQLDTAEFNNMAKHPNTIYV